MKPRYPLSLVLVLVLSWLLVGCATDDARPPAPNKPATATQPPVGGDVPEPPLLQDPALRTGKLRNGLRYAVYPNKVEAGRASLRLVVQVGSLHETEEQRGLAHFLEHMAFSGSTHYPPGKLTEFFQQIGMRIGADSNARTGFDRTEYMLELPRTDGAILAEAFQVFSDYAGGLLLLEEEIERERSVILSEKRELDSAVYRAHVASIEFLLGDSRFPKRMPIGEESVIRAAGRAQLLEFWNTWYRPERMTVVAVGDFDPKKVEAQIRKTFSPLKARAPARSEPDLGELTKLPDDRALYYYEPEVPATTVRITNIKPYVLTNLPSENSVAGRMLSLVTDIIVDMLNRRFMELSKKEGAPFLAARVTKENGFHFYRQTTIELSTRGEEWREALEVGTQEVRRAIQHGFRADELAVTVAEFRTSIEATARSAENRRTRRLAQDIALALYNEEPFTHPYFDYALAKQVLDEITPELCQQFLMLLFGKPPEIGPGDFVSVVGNAVIAEEEGKPPSEIILEVRRTSAQVPVEALAAPEAVKWAYADWGEPGKVVYDERLKDLDLRLIRFANGVRLNLKKTNFEPGLIRVSLRVGEGRITEPEGALGLASMAEAAFNLGGLGAHSVDDLDRIFAGHSGGAMFALGDDAFILNGQTFPQDARLHFQAIAAQLTDPGWRPEALRQVRRAIEQMYLSFKHTTNGPLLKEVYRLLLGGDPRLTLPEESVLLSRTMEEVRDWLGPQLARGPLEVAVVGDFDAELLISIVAETLGALPERAERRDLAELRQVKFPETPFSKSYRVQTQIDKGEVHVYWPTSDAMEAHRGRQLSLLDGVLEERLRVQVREKMGASYNPSTNIRASEVFPGYGYIEAACSVDPSQAEAVSDFLVQIGDALARRGVSKEELSRVRKPLLTTVREALRSNRYWLGVLSKAQEQPQSLDAARSFRSDVEGITAEELSELAREYFRAARASRALILPESA